MSDAKSRPIPLIVPMTFCYKSKHFETMLAPVWAEGPYNDTRKLLKSVGYTLVSNIGSAEVGMLIYAADVEAVTRNQDKQILADFPFAVIFEFANRMANQIVYFPSFPDLIELIGVDVWTTGRPSADRRRLPRPEFGDAEDEK